MGKTVNSLDELEDGASEVDGFGFGGLVGGMGGDVSLV